MYVAMYVCVCKYVCVCTHVCTYVHIYVRMYTSVAYLAFTEWQGTIWLVIARCSQEFHHALY